MTDRIGRAVFAVSGFLRLLHAFGVRIVCSVLYQVICTILSTR